MRPIQLTMQAFGSYGKRTVIDFEKPNQNLFLITGDTGSGKTTIFDAIASDAYSVPDLCQAWFDASVKAPYRNAVTAIITGATDIDGAMQFVADWQASIG